MKANRGDVQGMLAIARSEAMTGQVTRYLVPTINGLYTDSRPALAAACYRIHADGQVWFVPSSLERERDGKTETRVAGY
jgi:hypothetical protein